MDKKKALQFGLDIAGSLFPQIAAIENLAKAIPSLKGSAKEDAAIELIKNSSWFLEDVTDKELLSEPDVEAAIRGAIQAIVAVKNIVAAKKASKEKVQ